MFNIERRLNYGEWGSLERGFQSILDERELVGPEAVKEVFNVVWMASGCKVNLDYDGEESKQLVEYINEIIEDLRREKREKPLVCELNFRLGDGERFLSFGICGDVFFGRPNVQIAENALEAKRKWEKTSPRVPNYAGVNNYV